MRIQAKRLPLLAALVLALAVPTVVLAAAGYSLFGDASLVSPGFNSPTAVQLTSTGSTFSGINFDIPAGTTFDNIQNLGTDYDFTAGSCGGGSPRFQINMGGVNAFVYIGPPPNWTGCLANVWTSSGNLATPAGFIDTSQLPGGTQYDTFAAADLKYGTMAVTGIQLVADAGWLFGTQTVLVDNVQIIAIIYTFEGVDSCKKDGWMNFPSFPGPFKNQGDCVSYFSHIK
jgi:hypothetical protein